MPRLLDALKLDRAHIVGFSLGASTVAQLLTLHPERFLTATQAAGAGRSPKAANDPRIEVEASEIEKGCISRSRLYRQAPPNAKPTEDDYRKAEERCRADKNFDQYSVAASLRGYRDQAVTLEQMAAVKVPTLGIVGTLDHTLKEMQDLRQARPDMKFVLLEGVSHTGATGTSAAAGAGDGDPRVHRGAAHELSCRGRMPSLCVAALLSFGARASLREG